MKILHSEPHPPDFYVERFPVTLRDVITRAMAKKPADRFQSARELHESLEEFLLQAGIRCTSHDVAAYLDGLFPGLRDKASAEAAASLPVEVTDPTVPMLNVNVRGTDPGGGREPMAMGDLSSPHLGTMDDVRRNLGGGGRGGGSRFVVIALVVAVALGFWYLATHRGADTTADNKKPETAKPAVEPPKADKPATPTELPNPSGLSGEAAKPTSAPEVKTDAKPEAKTEAKKALEMPKSPEAKSAKPETEPTKKAEAPRPKPKPAHKEEPVRLPHLPTPPPPDDNP
jgi:hypothetical protein